MKKLFQIVLISTLFSYSANAEKLSDYVDPNIGTVHSRWFFYTPASLPFGMAKLGASTNGSYSNRSGWEAVGYEDGHTSIEGFPCFHEFQIGGVMLMPTTGEIKTTPGKLDDKGDGYRSDFDKKDEYATTGYYSVRLKDYGVKAELTATSRVGFQRYTFPAGKESNIIFDIGSRLGESGPVTDAYIKVIDKSTVEGYIITSPLYVQQYQKGASVAMYFYATIDKAADKIGTFIRGSKIGSADQIKGIGAGAALTYTTADNESVEVKVGLSYTSIENAKLNLQKEASKLDFDKAKAAATKKWEDYLGRIKVSGGSSESRTKFYTGLYHALLGRGLASDVNGAYPKNDGTIGQIALDNNNTPIHNHYNTDAMWGAYWNLTQLWSLAYPEYYNDFVNSQMLVYNDAGWLGDGIASSKYVSGVGTNMMSIVFAGAYNSGIRDYDVAKAYEAALKNEIGWQGRIEGAGRMDTKKFVELGYSPYNPDDHKTYPDKSRFSASHTLEYSFSAYAVAQWAKQLGKHDDYKMLMNLSKGWERNFDPEHKLIRPRLANGQFIDKFNPLESWRGFQEGNAVQYTFFVPGDPNALINKMGRDAFNNRLDSIFTIAQKSIFGGGKVVNAFSGLDTPYNHGNQPSLHISWLFNFSGKPWLTQKWTRAICDEFYGVTGEHGYGYGQDEDQGQLGAWYVMAAMGLFDVQGGASAKPTFQLGSPQFDKIEIDLSRMNSSGKRFVIETEGNAPQSVYVQSATFNGKEFNDNWLFSSDMRKGGVLKLKMGDKPNHNWGTASIPQY